MAFNEQPLVSIGIPTYNRPANLKNILSCITTQTHDNLQIIVADNCSSDENVKKVIESFCSIDKRIIYYRHEKNMGPVYNFQFVLDKAAGEYFMWAADDDEFSQNYIEENLEKIKIDAMIIGSYGAIKVESDVEALIKPKEFGQGGKFTRVRTFFRDPSYNMCFYSLFRMEIIKKTNIKQFGFYAGDWFFVACLLKEGKLVYSDNTYVVRGPGGLSSDPLKLLQFFYKDSRFKFIPFVKPIIKYLRFDFIAAILNLDTLFYYNFFYAEFSWNNTTPGKYVFLKKVNTKLKNLMLRVMLFTDKHLYKLKYS